MAPRSSRKRRRSCCAPRKRRLIVEQFEQRMPLANLPPAGIDATVSTQEDTAHVFAISDFGFSDVNDAPASKVFAVKIDSLPSAQGRRHPHRSMNRRNRFCAEDIDEWLRSRQHSHKPADSLKSVHPMKEWRALMNEVVASSKADQKAKKPKK